MGAISQREAKSPCSNRRSTNDFCSIGATSSLDQQFMDKPPSNIAQLQPRINPPHPGAAGSDAT
jgi:hypothetical protein